MADFNDVLTSFNDGLGKLARTTFSDVRDAAIADGEAFVKQSSDDIKRWIDLLTNEQINRKDFQFLLMSEKDLAELRALKRAGLTMVRLDQFKSSLIHLIVDSVFT
jgi:hypothetical protein